MQGVGELEVTVEGEVDDPSDVKKTTEDLLRRASCFAGKTVVHVNVVVEDEVNTLERAMQQDGFAALGAPSLLLGLAHQSARISVDVAVETPDGSKYAGHGTAEKLGSLYAPARKRALAVALDRALGEAAAAGKS